MNEPCAWPVDYVACGGVGDAYDSWGEGVQDEITRDAAIATARANFEAMAAELLWLRTGRIFGLCDVVLRPCQSRCVGDTSTFWGRGPFPPLTGAQTSTGWLPALLGGAWSSVGCGSCLSSCTCDLGAVALTLPGPVFQIDAVYISGELVPASAYRLDYGRRLLRTDGQAWPTCQDLAAEFDAEGAFSILYRRGVDVPIGGRAAAGALAKELAKAACGDEECALPQDIASLTRQGVQFTIADDVGTPTSSKPFGIRSVDQWVTAVTMPRPSATVRSVDIPAGRRIGSTPWPR